MVNSKDVVKQVEVNFAEFKVLTQDWCDNDNKVAAAKARSYSKKIIKDLRSFVELSIKEASTMEVVEVKPEQVDPVEQPEVATDNTTPTE